MLEGVVKADLAPFLEQSIVIRKPRPNVVGLPVILRGDLQAQFLPLLLALPNPLIDVLVLLSPSLPLRLPICRRHWVQLQRTCSRNLRLLGQLWVARLVGVAVVFIVPSLFILVLVVIVLQPVDEAVLNFPNVCIPGGLLFS